jgi:hypothetical protein
MDATRALFDAAIAQTQAEAEAQAEADAQAKQRASRGIDLVSESSMDSFPASDTPSWTPTRLGSP